MNILVLGASGMAGHIISLHFLEKGHLVTTLTRRSIGIGSNINLSINANNTKILKEVITANKFDAVINCIGILNKDADDNKETAVFLNSYLPHFLSETTKNLKTKIIHMSTDCVFSGTEGNYNETSFKNGPTFYDRSKALGELDNNKDLTFRNSIIGPDINENGIGLFNWFMKQNGEINGYDKAMWTGVTTLTLAKAMEKAIEQNLSGIYNLVNNDKINKFDLLRLFNKEFKNSEIEIIANSDYKIDKSLINTRKDFDFILPSYEKMIIEMKEWVSEHKEYYQHYFI